MCLGLPEEGSGTGKTRQLEVNFEFKFTLTFPH